MNRYGKYYAVFNVKNPDGKWSKKYVCTGLEFIPENETAAKEFLKEQIEIVISKKCLVNLTPEEIVPPDPNEGKNMFVDFVSKWIVEKEHDSKIDEVTGYFYRNMCDKHIIPYFSDKLVYLEDIDYKLLQDFIDFEMEKGNNNKDDSGLSPTSLKRLKTTLKLIFKDARMQRIINYDPCEFIKLPKQVKRLPTFFNEEQIKELFELIKDDYIYPIVYLTLLYGLRRSEVLGLKWDSVDFNNKLVTIKHTVVRTDKIVEKDRTKTESSYRTYPMSEDIEKLLLELKQEEIKNRKKYGKDYTDNDYIFKWPDGEMYDPDKISKRFSSLLKKNSLPHIRFHDLRHSCASLLIAKGFQLKDIQEWLGHADIETTANIYAHLDQSRKKELIASMKF